MPNPTAHTGTAHTLKLLSASANALDPRPTALYITVGGTIDITNEDDTTEAGVTVFAGQRLDIQPKKITTITGATLYGMYN